MTLQPIVAIQLRSDVQIITDPEVGKLLADETRRRILNILSHEEMSATDLAKKLDKNHSSIVHHLNTLLDAGLIEVTRQEQVRNMIQPYYKAVAKDFHVSYRVTMALEEDPDYSAWTDTYLERLIEGLGMYGVEIPAEVRPKVKQLLLQSHIYNKRAYEERILRKTDDKDIGRYAQRSIAHIVSHVQLLDNLEYKKVIEELREIMNKYSGSPWNVE
jgi:DNA-binding transcriptional ArsR family regulator